MASLHRVRTLPDQQPDSVVSQLERRKHHCRPASSSCRGGGLAAFALVASFLPLGQGDGGLGLDRLEVFGELRGGPLFVEPGFDVLGVAQPVREFFPVTGKL